MPNYSTVQQFITEENIISGEQAIILSGMQNTLLEETANQNKYFFSMTTFMVSDPQNLPPFNSAGVPKPSSIHSKTSSLVGGYIPVDPIFTRLDPNRIPSGHHHDDDLEKQEKIQVKWTLWEILKRCNSHGDCQMDWPFDGGSIVRFKFKDNTGPLGFTGCFQLDLGEEKKKSK